MKLTREEALKYHRQMWTDMQTELGDNPSLSERFLYKVQWCKKHFGREIENYCVLCEFTHQSYKEYHGIDCHKCPIDWNHRKDLINCECGDVRWYKSPISVILALPEREVNDELQKTLNAE